MTGRKIKYEGRKFWKLTKACEEIEMDWWYEMYDQDWHDEPELTSWHTEEEYDKIEKQREQYEERQRDKQFWCETTL